MTCDLDTWLAGSSWSNSKVTVIDQSSSKFTVTKWTKQCELQAATPAPLARWHRLVSAPAVWDTTQPMRRSRGVILRTTTRWRHVTRGNGIDMPPYGPRCANMRPSMKPEVHNTTQRCLRKTEPRWNGNMHEKQWTSDMWFWKCARGQILRQTDRHAHHNTPLPHVDGINILFFLPWVNVTMSDVFRWCGILCKSIEYLLNKHVANVHANHELKAVTQRW